jgi:hypothetical protein
MLPFSYKSESSAFGKVLLELVVKIHRSRLTQYVSQENMHSFQHGKSWLIVRDEGTEESSFKEAGVDISVEYQDILSNDINNFFKFLNDFVEGFTTQTVQQLYQMIDRTCEDFGNTVDRKSHTSHADAFLEALRRVEFGVNVSGQVEMPQLHVGKGFAEILKQSLEAQSDEFHAEVEKIKMEKSQAAIDREKARRNKFKGVKYEG